MPAEPLRKRYLGHRSASRIVVTLAAAAAIAFGCAQDAVAENPLSLVNVLMGTGVGAPDFGTGSGSGATFPGASLPFGMTQFSPDTLPTTGNPAGGYTYTDTHLRGFSVDHFSGGGCAIFQDIPILPTETPVTVSPDEPGSSDLQARYIPRFDHAHERATPGSYHVTLNPGSRSAIDAELTATTRTADARFTFSPTARASVLFDVGGSALADYAAAVRIDPRRREVLGHATSGHFCFQPTKYTIYFVARFARPFAAYGTWERQRLRRGATVAADANPAASNYKPTVGGPPSLPGNPSTTAQAGAYLTFDARRVRRVEMNVGVSFTSLAQARRNLAAEASGRPFRTLQSAAGRTWRGELAKISVRSGTRRDRRLLYSSLYHALLEPNVFSDADGTYRGMDGRLHVARGFTMYTNVSGWDVYRTQTQLMAMLEPRRAADLVRSLLADARQSGCFPRWPYADQQTNIMVGDPSPLIAADAFAFRAPSLPLRRLARALAGDATGPCHTANGDYTQREGVHDYVRLGYVPAELNTDAVGHTLLTRSRPWGSAATTLEYALADFAISRVSRAGGLTAQAAAFARRARNWRFVVNPQSGYAELRSVHGDWLSPFDPASMVGFVEGNGAQYTWSVPQDVAGLVGVLGGRSSVRSRLDRFFETLNSGPLSPHAYLGNEPTLGSPWLYDWVGAPARTSEIVSRALSRLYAPTPAGMPGNDDGGTMGAWWVFAALGLYPAIPGTDVLTLNAPQFPDVALHLPDGTVRIVAPGAGAARRYIGSVRLNGRPHRMTWLSFRAIANGGRIVFRLATRPTPWGRALADAPPSFR